MDTIRVKIYQNTKYENPRLRTNFWTFIYPPYSNTHLECGEIMPDIKEFKDWPSVEEWIQKREGEVITRPIFEVNILTPTISTSLILNGVNLLGGGKWSWVQKGLAYVTVSKVKKTIRKNLSDLESTQIVLRKLDEEIKELQAYLYKDVYMLEIWEGDKLVKDVSLYGWDVTRKEARRLVKYFRRKGYNIEITDEYDHGPEYWELSEQG